MVLNAAAQALRQAEDLKKKILQGNEISGPTTNRTLSLTQLQKAYQKVLLIDLDYALDKKVEQDLWNVGFKNQIELLQSTAKDKKNPRRAESQTLLLWVLQAATGFYICLLHQICTAFKLNLPFRCNIPYPWGELIPYIPSRPPQSSSCWYICQHCLVHLGDLARYSRQPRRADSFYRQALTVSPRNGQPYNQLGLLRAARGDRLGAAYYHARGLAVGGPFPPAANNLARTLAASSTTAEGSLSPDSRSPSLSLLPPATRLSAHTYTGTYMSVHHRLQSSEGLAEAEGLLQSLGSMLTALVATDEFQSDTIVKMSCLDLYAVYSVTDGHKLEASAMTEDERRALSIAMELVAGTLAALLLPAHTRAAQEMLTYPALPAVKVLLEWIKIHPHMLKEPPFVSRLELWPGLCALLNTLQLSIKDFNGQEYEVIPLPEDEELQGYLPIDLAFSKLKFLHSASSPNFNNGNGENIGATDGLEEGTSIREMLAKRKNGFSISDIETLKKDLSFIDSLRAHRLIQLGEWLAEHLKENGMEYISVSEKDGIKVFTPIQNTLENNPDLLKAIEALSLLREKRLNECVELDSQLSETVSSASQRDGEDNLSDSEGKVVHQGSLSKTGEDSLAQDSDLTPPIVISEADFKDKVREKRAGILKPQGSLERARGEKAALCRAARVETLTPESVAHSTGDLSITPSDGGDNQDTGSSCSTVSQDGNICTDVGCLLDPPIGKEGGDSSKGRKGRTNVAMQAIMRKQEESSKQVKFLTPVTTPDSIGELNQFSPLSSSKDHIDKKKIIQPKVIKSLASIPTDRKTGGILSLKDKSAGYPHLVNTEPPAITDAKLEMLDQSATSLEDKATAKVQDSKQLNMASQHAEFGKYPSSTAQQSPGKITDGNQVKKVTEHEGSNLADSGYIPWSDGTSARPHFQQDTPAKEDKYSNRIQNSGAQNKPMNFSYFSSPDNQNSSITLPVMNPKEIDIRSVALQKQKSMQVSNDAMIDQYNKESMPQYNYWYGASGPNPNVHSPGQRDAAGRHTSLPPRLANLKKTKNNPEYVARMQDPQMGGFRYQEGPATAQQSSPGQSLPAWNTNSQQPQTTWWKPSNHEANYDSTYQQPSIHSPRNYPQNYYGNPQHPNINNLEYQDQSNFNFNQQNAMQGRNPQNVSQSFPENSQTSPRYNVNASNYPMYSKPGTNYPQYNPYNPGMYPQFSTKFGFSQQPIPKPTIGNEYSLNPYPSYPNASQFGLAQSINQTNQPKSMNDALLSQFTPREVAHTLPLEAPIARQPGVPEFVPRRVSLEGAKGYEVSTPKNDSRKDRSMDSYKYSESAGPPAGNTYSLFSAGPESWGASPLGGAVGGAAPQQSLWSGPGPSPLERLLEQQKQFKYPPNE